MAFKADLSTKTVIVPDLGEMAVIGATIDLTDGGNFARGVIVQKSIDPVTNTWTVWADVVIDSMTSDKKVKEEVAVSDEQKKAEKEQAKADEEVAKANKKAADADMKKAHTDSELAAKAAQAGAGGGMPDDDDDDAETSKSKSHAKGDSSVKKTGTEKDNEHTVGALTPGDKGKRFTWKALEDPKSPDKPFTAVLESLSLDSEHNVQSAKFKADADGRTIELPATEPIWYAVP